MGYNDPEQVGYRDFTGLLGLLKRHEGVDAITGTQRVFIEGLEVKLDKGLKNMGKP